jgi:hypothetical protein
MTDEFEVRNFWQGQGTEGLQFSPDEIRRKARAFERTIRFRNLREYLALVAVAPVFCYFAWSAHNLPIRVGSVLAIAGSSFVAVQLHRRGSARLMSAEMGGTACLDFQRNELVRQRDLLQNVWWWYLAPLMIGPLVIMAGAMLARPSIGQAVITAGMIAFCFLVAHWNRSAARSLQRKIDALDAWQK